MRTYRRVVIGVAMFVCLVCGPVASASAREGTGASERGCSNATLAGSYGFSIKGTNLALGVEFIFVGQFTTNGAGELTGRGTQNVQGSILRAPFTGDYRVDPDCSGTGTITFAPGVFATMDFVIVDSGRELLLIIADQGTLESGIAKRIAVRPRW